MGSSHSGGGARGPFGLGEGYGAAHDASDGASMPMGHLAKSERLYHAEQDRMTAMGTDNIKAHCRNNFDRLSVQKAILLGLLLAFASFACFVTMLCVWFHVYHSSFIISCGVLAGLLIASLLVELTRRGRRWLVWMGPLCAQGALVGTLLGFVIYFQFLAYYYAYQDLRVYTDVAGSQRASAFGDASMLLFTEDTRLDALRTVGFYSKWTGDMACVAPVADPSMGNDAPVQFFAVGENCCLPRSEFNCDGAQDPTVRSGLVILEPEDVARPWMRWAVGRSMFTSYEKAIKLQAGAYFTHAAQKPKLLRWTRNPEALKDKFYTDGLKAAYGFGSFYFLVCLALGALGARSWCLGQPGPYSWQQAEGGWAKIGF